MTDALSNPSVCNIAITGPFGSGKSSFIKSFEKSTKKNFAYVSLAEFDFDAQVQPSTRRKNETPDDFGDSKRSNDLVPEARLLNALERNIVNQLMAAGNTSKVKWGATTFHTEKSLRRINALSIAFIVYIVIAALSTLFVSQLSCLDGMPIAEIAIGIFAVLICALIFLFVWYVKIGCPPLIKNISAGNARIELQNPAEYGSFFDQNLAFVLRVFESRPERTYVFEDLDRLKQDELFVHLRELNAILNNYFREDRNITFIYCLSDNVLKGESRTKFFDVIIPIVPYVNSYNAYAHLKEELGSEFNNLPSRLLKNTALYINDYRQLLSIVHEYNVYKSCLNTPEKDPYRKKLFSLISLKTICPDLFQNLVTKQGSFYEYVSNLHLDDPFDHGKLRSKIDKDLNRFYSDAQIDKITSFCDYLIQNRYLEKDYYFYISNEDNEMISREDRAWLIEARNGKKDPYRVLDSPKVVLDYFEETDFMFPDLLNISILDTLLTQNDLDHFQSIANCTLKDDHDFAIAATEQLSLFPVYAIAVDNRFFGKIKGLNRTKFTLSILDNLKKLNISLQTVNNNNDNFIEEEIRENAGTYTSETLSIYSENIVNALVEAANTLDVCIETLKPAADKTLLFQIVESERFIMSELNCLVICDLFCDPGKTATSILDRMKVSNRELAWNLALEDPTRFVNEFFFDESIFIACQKSTFLELFNLETNKETKAKLLSRYKGDLLNLSEIKSTADWPIALDHQAVNKSLDNVAQFIKQLEINQSWINFVNSFSNFDLSPLVVQFDEQTYKSILIQDNLRNNIYREFANYAPKKLFDKFPEQLSNEKVVILFKNNLIELTVVTLDKARTVLSTEDLCFYEAANLDDFVQTARSRSFSSASSEEEILNLLYSLEGSPESIEQLCQVPFSPIATIEKLSNETLKTLLSFDKISANAFQGAINRFGQSDSLDEEIEKLISGTSISNLRQLTLPSGLACKVISRLTPEKQLVLIEQFAKNNTECLEKLLRSLNNEVINSILDGKHPKAIDMNTAVSAIVNVLKNAGLISQGNDGKIYKKKWN